MKRLFIGTLALLIGAFAAQLVTGAGPTTFTTAPTWPTPPATQPSNVINLDPLFIPRSGPLPLQLAATYTLSKSKPLRSDTWSALGGAASDSDDPVIVYTGPRDSAAMYSLPGDTPFLSDVIFRCPPWTYALSSRGDLDAGGVHVEGGGGLLVAQGATGTTRLNGCAQSDPTDGYLIYVGPISSSKRDLLGRMTAYSEKNSGTLIVDGLDARQGSRYVALIRAGGVEHIVLRNINASDTEAQSAPGAVKNAVLRIHGTGGDGGASDVDVEDSTFTGDVNFGPYVLDKDLPAATRGPQRVFEQGRRIGKLTVKNCVFDSGVFTIEPGVRSATFDHCTIRATGSAVINCPLKGVLVQEFSTVTFTDCEFVSSHAARAGGAGGPQAFGGSDARAWSRMKMIDCTVNGVSK